MESIITTTRRSAILPNNCMQNANLHTLCNDCFCSSTNERKLDYVEVFISTRALVILQGMAVYRVLDHFANSHRSEEHTSELQSRFDLVCRLLLEKKNNTLYIIIHKRRHQVCYNKYNSLSSLLLVY